MAKGFSHPKAIVNVGDGFEYLKNHQNEFDVIITDSSDPEGPAESLFQESFYALLKSALKPPHGIICCQGESVWLHLNLIKQIVSFTRNVFPSVAYAFASTPTYPSGTIGFLLCSLDEVRFRHWKSRKKNENFLLEKSAQRTGRWKNHRSIGHTFLHGWYSSSCFCFTGVRSKSNEFQNWKIDFEKKTPFFLGIRKETLMKFVQFRKEKEEEKRRSVDDLIRWLNQSFPLRSSDEFVESTDFSSSSYLIKT